MILALQNIISREIKPTHGAVITTGELNAGTLVNVIPDTAPSAELFGLLILQTEKKSVPEWRKYFEALHLQLEPK